MGCSPRPDLLRGTTAEDSGGAPERSEQSGEDTGVQGGGTMAEGTGGSSLTGRMPCTGCGTVGGS